MKHFVSRAQFSKIKAKMCLHVICIFTSPFFCLCFVLCPLFMFLTLDPFLVPSSLYPKAKVTNLVSVFKKNNNDKEHFLGRTLNPVYIFWQHK